MSSRSSPVRSCFRNENTNTYLQLALMLLAASSLLSLVGCSTLESLGLSVSNGSNRMLKTAEAMASAATAPAPLPRELNMETLSEYLVAPGDVLYVEADDIGSQIRFPGDQTVQPNGVIDLGKYGRLSVVGKTVPEIESEIQAIVDAVESAEFTDLQLEDNENEQSQEGDRSYRPSKINVRLIRWDSKVYYVLGEVNSPGAYPFIGRETVLDAIIAAGGLGNRANQHQIILARPSLPGDCRTVLPICYKHITQLGDTSTNYQIQPGDRVFVASLTHHQEMLQFFRPRRFECCPICGPAQHQCDLSQIPTQTSAPLIDYESVPALSAGEPIPDERGPQGPGL